MRNIKFRGKLTESGEWAHGDLVHAADGIRTAILVSDKNIYDECEVFPSTVGQFTGLKDCHGTDIYEGDIVKACSQGEYRICEVAWSEKTLGFFLRHQSGPWFLSGAWGLETVEIIGNIHDNPEILNPATKDEDNRGQI